ncbi:alcohol dehydrogenase-like protein [Aaosphaeria arxii CBS 175.79]|uniref:Alcohol dehydrogenase-like protein n=1 Tax=Aaosphaeria arxii CBS 175.79 TaxID=1450172 RepID=A0A6A5XX36_9PLEO|nr:alcohol dehydrogenase-like protein [Aaosphaeria arxii CBS 175.79]KAF2017271.1 alcohol dehydrogenase-like protein [Aaosphaeria arxii CBS 175.79]
MTSAELPKKYKAAVYDKPGSISTKIEELDLPEPGPGEVLINLTHSGVCHSDMGVMMNSWSMLPAPTQPGQVGGHEGVGKIVKLGAGTEGSGVKLGDRVGIKWMAGVCNACEACRAGIDASCFNGKISGYYTPGTFQQYALGPANYVTPIPEGLDSAAAAPMLCAGVTVYSALKKSNAVAGNWVALLGAGGGLGHLAVQFSARGLGHRVIGIDHSSKKDIVLESGAEHFLPIDGTDDIVNAVKELTGGLGVHAVLVLTANNAAYGSSIDMLRFGGRVVCVGIPENEPVPIKSAYPSTLVGKSLSVVGSAVGDRKEAIETLDFAARGIVKTHYRTEKMDKLTDVFKEMHDGTLKGRVVLDLQ